jgi:hypothetical protein
LLLRAVQVEVEQQVLRQQRLVAVGVRAVIVHLLELLVAAHLLSLRLMLLLGRLTPLLLVLVVPQQPYEAPTVVIQYLVA